MSERTIVHLLRHGEVHNPEGVLYGRLPGYHLSERGRTMAERVAERVADRDITHVFASPLERAQETAAPIAAALGVGVITEPAIIESTNVFEGKNFAVGDGVLRKPSAWVHLWNPFKPSWGEPYAETADRMRGAILSARDQARGHEAMMVSHQMPIWVARLSAEHRPFIHDPRRRQCTVCSLTSFEFGPDGGLAGVSYSEPVADLLAPGERRAPFSTGGAPAEKKPV